MNKRSCRGISLVEIVLSMGILVVIMLPVFMTFSSGNRNMQVTESEFRAHTAALELLEQTISLPFNLIKTGSYDSSQVINGQPFSKSPVQFMLSENSDLKPELRVEEIKRGDKVVFKKVTVKVVFPAAKNSEKMREFTLKTIVANENI